MAIMDPLAVTLEGAGAIETRNTVQVGRYLYGKNARMKKRSIKRNRKKKRKNRKKQKRTKEGHEVEVRAARRQREFVDKTQR